jgi:hypothetical protein
MSYASCTSTTRRNPEPSNKLLAGIRFVPMTRFILGMGVAAAILFIPRGLTAQLGYGEVPWVGDTPATPPRLASDISPYQDGRLGCIQPVGAAPGDFTVASSYVFGTGAFLLAGLEFTAWRTNFIEACLRRRYYHAVPQGEGRRVSSST